MASLLTLETERLILRLPERDDADAMAAYFLDNREHLQPFYPTFEPTIIRGPSWRERIALTEEEYRHRKSVRLALALKVHPRKIVGVANFTSITGDPKFACTLGYSLASDVQGQGLMREALAKAIPFVVSRHRLHRIEAAYMPGNQRSGKLLRSLGFVEEGLARDYLLIDGRWRDHVLTSYTVADWR